MSSKEYKHQWYLKHKEEVIERSRLWQRNNPEKCREIKRNWQSENLEKHRIYNLVYHHPELYPLASVCAFCGRTEKLEHGHMDYQNDGYNYLTVCHTCNIWMNKN